VPVTAVLKAPFPYFGGKSRVATDIWARFGAVKNYVEPFFGTGAVLMARPDDPGVETVNDADGFLANFWRAVKEDPDAVAYYADYPVSEIDLHARHGWLINRKTRLRGSMEDPDFYDPKAAGWWVWGISCWIGGGWCSGAGPWRSDGAHIIDSRQLPHLGDAGRGVNRKLPHLGDAGRGVNRKGSGLSEYFAALSERLRSVRVCCGDWGRVCGPSVTTKHGLTAVFLDPPYSHALRGAACYSTEDDCSTAVREWAIEHGSDPLMRIALAGYETEHEMPSDWECLAWKAGGGFDGQKRDKSNQNRKLERVWFSPGCLRVEAQMEIA